MVGIYKITNKINGKCYIGQSTNIEERWQNHRSFPLEVSHYPLYQAFVRYGLENFEFEVIEECLVKELNKKEEYYINLFHSLDNGYNQTLGGQNATYQKLSPLLVEEITEDLRDTKLTGKEISKKYQIGEDMVSRINHGKSHRRDIEYPIRTHWSGNGKELGLQYCVDCSAKISRGSTRCIKCAALYQRVVERPSKEDLLEMVALNGFAATGREFGVSDKAIQKWCRNYNLPYLIKDIKKLYGNYTESITTTPQFKHKNFFCEDKEGVKYKFNSITEAVNWLIEKGYTSAKPKSIGTAIGRVLNGQRKTYLKFKWGDSSASRASGC